MCGIAGTYSTKNSFSENDIRNMTHRLKHRGPDANNIFISNECMLGHTRLSIIDLSDNANQPMTSQCGRYVMVYNGEVYNYNEIASELKYKTNIQLKTNSDSEVILEAFALYKTEFVKLLNGMFSIAIYDKKNEELFLFRDRMGIKPLHYFYDGNDFAFASEIKSLLELGNISKDINYNAIRTFLNIGYIPHPHSIYKNIQKLLPGHYILLSKKNLEIKEYWSAQNSIEKEIIEDEKKALIKLSDLLASSVQYQLRTDVPFGVFLSGGVDSSLITALAVQMSGVKVNTFSIGFEEAKYNESEHAKEISKYLNTQHHEFFVSYKDAIDLIDTYFDTYDEPFADSSGIPTLLLSKLSKQNVTVTLSGEGGDELFMGYGFYVWAERLNNPLISLTRKPIGAILSYMSNKYKRASHLFQYTDTKHLKSHIFSQEQYFFSENEINGITTHDFKGNLTNQLEDYYAIQQIIGVQKRILDVNEAQALFDIMYYLPQNLLTKVDRASMRYSLETRVPYLDHRIVEFALNLSPDLKIKNGIQKYILKQILYQYIPEKYFNRPKQGFAIPLGKWLKTDLKYLIDNYLNPTIVEKHKIVNYKHVENLLHLFFNGNDYIFNRVWQLIVIHKWMEKHNIN